MALPTKGIPEEEDPLPLQKKKLPNFGEKINDAKNKSRLSRAMRTVLEKRMTPHKQHKAHKAHVAHEAHVAHMQHVKNTKK